MKSLHEMRPAIIHRDLKSLNVFVTKKEEKWRMKVADFGLSRSPEAEMMTTQLGTIVIFLLIIALDGSITSGGEAIFSQSRCVFLWSSSLGDFSSKNSLFRSSIANGHT